MIESTDTQRDTTQFANRQISLSPYLYFLAGAGIGAGLALLFAPKSGVELRTDIADLTRKSYDETIDFAHQIKEQSAEVIHSFKEKTGHIYDFAANRFTNPAGASAQLPGEVITGGTNRTQNISSQQDTQLRNPTNIH
jgi:gas vesicle protein